LRVLPLIENIALEGPPNLVILIDSYGDAPDTRRDRDSRDNLAAGKARVVASATKRTTCHEVLRERERE
jgi:hypothetical protein